MFKSIESYERFRRVVSFVSPNRCAFCGEVMNNNDYWCGMCYRHLPFIWGIVRPPDNISELYACCFYVGRARDAVLELKYRGSVYPADAFAAMLGKRLREADVRADMLIPVPNGSGGIKTRGFSSSELIARRLSLHTGIPAANAVRADRHKTEQKSLSAYKRVSNAMHGFYIEKNADIKGRRIILVDDVTTTGSTLSAVGGLLLEAGAADVSAAVFAKTLDFVHTDARGKRYTIRKRPDCRA